MPREKKSLREICREVGVSHLQVTEVFRRIENVVMQEGKEVITHGVGTFYPQDRAATRRTLNEVVYEIPARRVVALRGPRFPATEQMSCPQVVELLNESGGVTTGDVPINGLINDGIMSLDINHAFRCVSRTDQDGNEIQSARVRRELVIRSPLGAVDFVDSFSNQEFGVVRQLVVQFNGETVVEVDIFQLFNRRFPAPEATRDTLLKPFTYTLSTFDGTVDDVTREIAYELPVGVTLDDLFPE